MFLILICCLEFLDSDQETKWKYNILKTIFLFRQVLFELKMNELKIELKIQQNVKINQVYIRKSFINSLMLSESS